MTHLPITLLSAAAAVFINIWLGWRIAEHREQYKVSVGDGGHEPLLRRMRAQSNFIEQAPFFLILLGGLELSGANRTALASAALVFMLARVAHGIGMDGGPVHRLRAYGIAGSVLANLVLAVWAVVCAAGILLGR
jgi:uncharacterized membrane protein YecN with MAPEG domain